MQYGSAVPVEDCDPPNTIPVIPSIDMARAVLTPEEHRLFAEFGRSRQMSEGDLLFRRGDHGTTMFVISQGGVDLDFGEDLAVKHLGAYEFFGELGLLIGDHTRTANAYAATDATLIELCHTEFEQMVARDPAQVSYFLRSTIMRVLYSEQNLIRQLRRRNQDLQAALDNLYTTTHQLNQTEELIRTDELTGLYNRRGLTLHLQEYRRIGMPACMGLLLIDCDCFKRVNDEHGHLAGDRVLQSVANILLSVIGPGDIACRLGGDEFCLLLTANCADDVMRFANFIVATAQSLMSVPQSLPNICPVSVGACLVDPQAEWSEWYAHADAALYQAKRLGGNRVQWKDTGL